ncbi:MAG: hypothetical protein A2527_07260 [Candidatus Lambdaproteobacteria bacterium RIFOXYD2_FULL_50_16]|uniref:Uncharacterized protein n=1 Tax=Candidatus Lambdaproteobacteria bacterium RIFOXYD2_FULL_50_16 TaxID=1817772 RepID=A0A1F6GB34_9PROT|nr:MAG: hypothetical protein A2527_07260 [Candidatus Lambdaproteobacteria bacterium RIFOXYD2_FULL_50_16]
MKFNLGKKKPSKYLYLVPSGENYAQWEILDQDELDRRVEANELKDNGRLFALDKELTIRTEKTTYID